MFPQYLIAIDRMGTYYFYMFLGGKWIRLFSIEIISSLTSVNTTHIYINNIFLFKNVWNKVVNYNCSCLTLCSKKKYTFFGGLFRFVLVHITSDGVHLNSRACLQTHSLFARTARVNLNRKKNTQGKMDAHSLCYLRIIICVLLPLI